MVTGIFRADLRVTSKKTALEFYRGVKGVILLPLDVIHELRIEPGCHISVISTENIKNGTAPFVPALHDADGTIAYNYRKHINQYLRSFEE